MSLDTIQAIHHSLPDHYEIGLLRERNRVLALEN